MRLALAVACTLLACSPGELERTNGKPVPQPTTSVPAPSTQGATVALAPAAAPPSDGAKWDNVKLEDEVPLCVFASHLERGKASFLRDVHPQTLRSSTTLVFGTFSPGCQNEACDTAPTHQCWVDSEEPNILVVHSRLSFEHKRGTVCTEDCHPVTAGCETEVLKPGKYIVKYGARSFSLRIPSVLSAPCLQAE
jgi:hypothetical protein